MSESFAIVKEHPDLLKYVDKLQRANAESLSFYPLSAFEREAENRANYMDERDPLDAPHSIVRVNYKWNRFAKERTDA